MRIRRIGIGSLALALLLQVACSRQQNTAQPDAPRLTPKATLHDVTFYSTSLKRDMPYRVVLPVSMAAAEKLPALYLLHGGGGGFRDWSNYSDVARFAESGLVLVMPEGNSSYYVNAAERSQDRYEDYIVNDLIADVEHRFPVAAGRANRAIVGVSMGGYGAVNLSLRHPDLFSFAAGISPAIDTPSRPFSWKRIGQWRRHGSIFGPWQGEVRRANDPYVLVASANPAQTPYFFLTCGEQEGLLPANRRLAALLAQRHSPHEFHVVPGGHNWTQWNDRLPDLFRSLSLHIHSKN